jgi:hypothetical protein
MKSYYYSPLFDRMMDCESLGKVYPCIGVFDKDGKELMLGSVVELLSRDSPLNAFRSIYRVVYQAPSFMLKNDVGQIQYLDNIKASSLRLLGHIENYTK